MEKMSSLVMLFLLCKPCAILTSNYTEPVKKQVTSHTPSTLDELYKKLELYQKNDNDLYEYHQQLSALENKQQASHILERIEEELDVNSYHQKFILKKITIIEQLHSSVPENMSLNAFVRGKNEELVVLYNNNNDDNQE